MASRTTVTLVDDLDGQTAEETVPFGLDGLAYEIDLSSENASGLRDALARYIEAARRTGGRRNASVSAPARNAQPATNSSRARNQEIRAWAQSHGVSLAERGRIPGHVVSAFEAGDPSQLGSHDQDGGKATPAEVVPAEPSAEAPAAAYSEHPAESGEAEQPRGRDGLTGGERETIRAWAANEGIEVKARGMLKKDLIANYVAWSARQA